MNGKRFRWGSLLSLLTLVLLSSGCGKSQLYTNVSEKQANEMVALLRARNLSVSKIAGAENTWTLEVANNHFANAVDILNNHGYPKDEFQTMDKVFQKSGLVSSPTEERARFMYALSEDLAETISNINGVVTARVHIVLPEDNPYNETVTPSSAAVFISYRPDSNVEDSIRDIKYLVTNSVEGLSYDKVTVALFPAQIIPEDSLPENQFVNVLSIHMTKASLWSFWLFVGILVFGVAAVSFVLAKILFDYLAVKKEERMKREQAKAAATESSEEKE